MKNMKPARMLVSLGVSAEGSTLSIIDPLSRETIFDARHIPADKILRLLSREAFVPIDGECSEHLERVGMRRETRDHLFPLPEGTTSYSRDCAKVAWRVAQETCPDGWEPVNHFNSQNSFFARDGRTYARCTIQRWIPAGEEPNEDETDN